MDKRQFDAIVRIVNPAAAAEIKRLRARLRRDGREGRKLLAKYALWSPDPAAPLGLPHDVEDFLQSVGEG